MKPKTIDYLIVLALFIGLFSLASVEAAPAITAYNNSVSGVTLYPHVQHSGSIQFNVTVNESVNYTWYKDGTSISNNFDNLTTSWTGPGQKNITVYGTNANGSTAQLSWFPLVEQEMAGAGDTITEMNLSAYNSILEVVSSEDPDYEAFLFALSQPHTNIIGSLFYVLLYGAPFLFIWIGQGSAKIPATLACFLAPVMLGSFNADYIGISVLLILLTLFGLIYTLYKERGT
jgi:hypothetical protein